MSEEDEDKIILDACCGGRMFWFQKEQENTIYLDIREEEPGFIKYQPNFKIQPDVVGDYTNLPFEDERFKLVVWDVPHKIKGNNSIISKKYGKLGTDWKRELSKGFNEVMRVLQPYGVLNFKFSDVDIKISTILECFKYEPLFGTVTKKGVNNTYWMTFMKPKEELEEESE